ncbi:MAG TPA: hypothetical protein VJM33_07350 [Microthrixaceae bacterium]|nr:hypothetical protein [Microthrixaceae bacterium]
MADAAVDAPEIPGAPYDLEFFFDPGCPFAWLTSRWATRVAELRDLRIGWRFISLRMVNEARDDLPEGYKSQQVKGTEFLRICAATRASVGNDAVAALYTGWGEALWNQNRGDRPYRDARREIVEGIDIEKLLVDAGADPGLIAVAQTEDCDALIRAETDLALARAGNDLGTPIITYGPPDGPSYFGPVISVMPADDEALELYDAIRTMSRFGWYSELKRTNRAPLDLPLITG